MNRRERENPIVGPGHTGVRDLLRLVGPAVLGVGVLLIVIGVGSFFSAFGSFGTGNFGPPKYFWCVFLGMPVLFVGIVLCGAGYTGAVNRYMAGEVAPVAKDTFNYMAHGTRDGVRDLATALGEGIAAGVAGAREHATEEEACPSCGAASPAGAQFCPGCGASFLAARCSSCGGQLVPGAKFCHRCGAPSRSSEIA
jgi:ribosomal protein L40E